MSRATYLYMTSRPAPPRPVAWRVRAPRLPSVPGLDDRTSDSITPNDSTVQVLFTCVLNAVKRRKPDVVLPVTLLLLLHLPLLCVLHVYWY